jgi:tetratricopeptide (TPR) repeat protein
VCLKCSDRSQELEKCQQDLALSQQTLVTREQDLGLSQQALGTCQQDLWTCDQALRTCQQDLGACEQILGTCQQELKLAKYENFKLKIDKFSLLKVAKAPSYDSAEEIYQELISKCDELGKDDRYREPILNLKYEYAAMQIERRKYPEAEKIAREVFTAREGGEEEPSEDYKSSHRQLILALRRQGRDDAKVREAEHMLRKIWPIREQRDLWKFENGDMLCTVLEERGRYDNAHALQRNVWTAREAQQGRRDKDTIRSALRLAEIMNTQIQTLEKGHKKNYLEEELEKVFGEIWDFWGPGLLQEEAFGVLTAGYKLGHLHCSRQDYLKAKPILIPVWEGMKSVLGETSEHTISAGVDLALVYFGLKEYPGAESTSTWVWKQQKVRFGNEHPRTLEARHDVGRAVLAQGERYQYAESIFDEVYKARRASDDFGRLHKDTLTCGHYLNEAIAKQEGGCLNAAMQIKEVFELRRQELGVNDPAVLESGYLYGCLLFELATSQNIGSTKLGNRQELLQKAEEVFSMLWQARNRKSGLEYAKILESGRCLALSQFELQKYVEGCEVLGGVWSCKKKESGEESSETLEYGYQLAQSLMAVMSRRPNETAMAILKDVWDAQERQGESGAYKNLHYGHSLGDCLMKLEEYEEAKEVLEVVWERQQEGGGGEPENSDYAFSLGVCLLELKDYKMAKSILKKVNFEERDDRKKEADEARRTAREEIRKRKLRRSG